MSGCWGLHTAKSTSQLAVLTPPGYACSSVFHSALLTTLLEPPNAPTVPIVEEDYALLFVKGAEWSIPPLLQLLMPGTRAMLD